MDIVVKNIHIKIVQDHHFILADCEDDISVNIFKDLTKKGFTTRRFIMCTKAEKYDFIGTRTATWALKWSHI